MARCSGRNLNFGCLTCKTEFTQFCWLYSDPYDQDKNTPFPSACPNPDCASPHIAFIPRNRSFAQVRESQRCVVYVYPDGDYAALPVTDPSAEGYAEMVETARSAGGVRMEFNSIHELRDFQKRRGYQAAEEWQQMSDAGMFEESGLQPTFKQLQDAIYAKSRNEVLEYDEKALKNGEDFFAEQRRERQKKYEESRERFLHSMEKAGFRVGRAADNERYRRLSGK